MLTLVSSVARVNAETREPLNAMTRHLRACMLIIISSSIMRIELGKQSLSSSGQGALHDREDRARRPKIMSKLCQLV